ncbi:lasso peptide biosynthesis PqqD family chaperone [Amycolatopsis sp. NPDC059021]|uniref:lasso peptide biosynthesis PqqD family chaperone n=1 Tax=Amycolatopsis sp. NPDC059021 TaxID=3346704 RepID=UPI00366F871A
MTMSLRDDVSLAETGDGGGVLLDERSGQYWQLNSSGFTALRMGLADAGEHEIARALADDGSVGLEQVVADVRELVGRLVTAGLVVRS